MALIILLSMLVELIKMLMPIVIIIGIICLAKGKRKYSKLTSDKSWQGYYDFLKDRYWTKKK